MSERHRVVVVGGGFAGVDLCLGLKHHDCDVTLVDRRNFHLFQPLLYQVATGGLSPGDISAPLRTVVKDAKNVRSVVGDVVDIDVDNKLVVLKDQAPLAYDTLVVATGVAHSYFGN
ncbi:MAG TPA: FAD-dependent oxidoreductase, partial [Myxococcota bacterium]